MDPVINAVRRAAWIDLLLFSALAIPGISVWLLSALIESTYVLGTFSQNSNQLTDFSQPITQLCLNLMGLFGVFFALARLKNPLEFLTITGHVKLLAAALFSIGLANGLPAVFLMFLLIDVIVGIQHYRLAYR